LRWAFLDRFFCSPHIVFGGQRKLCDTTPDWNVRREYSYPFLYRSRDGRIHLLYTWQRTRIRHLVFNDAWVVAEVR